jgi:polyisoprenoid-binding protein YceI
MRPFFTLFLALFSIAFAHAQALQPVDEKSEVKFVIKNFGINTGGFFKGVKGTIVFDAANPSGGSFDISLAASTVNTDNSSRDNHLHKEEYFNVEKYPLISFKSDKITGSGSGKMMVFGKLTIKGVTKDISFPFKAIPKEEGYLFEGSFQINRRDYTVGSGSMVLSDNVTVTLSVFAKKK